MQAKIYDFLKKNDCDILIVENDKEAELAADVAFYLKKDPVVLPDFRPFEGDDLRSYKKELDLLLAALGKFYKKPTLLISPYNTLARYLPGPSHVESFDLEFGERVDINSLKERLFRWGYSLVDVVQEKGEASFRGDIIDIFPLEGSPLRISLFDEEIESLRRFDPATQKSEKEELERVTIGPALFSLEEEEFEELKSSVECSEFDVFYKDIPSIGFWYLKSKVNLLSLYKATASKDLEAQLEELYSQGEGLVPKESFNVPVIKDSLEYEDLEFVNIDAAIEHYGKTRDTVVIASSEAAVRRSGLKSFENIRFLYDDLVLNVKGPKELILSLNRTKRRSKIKRSSLILDELRPGDYVVHENHGIGVFEGLEPVKVMGATRDFVVLRYQNGDRLLVPVENIDLIERYIADSGALPVLDRLGSASFSKLKSKVKKRLFEIASEIVQRAAKREMAEGIRIDCSKEEIALFQQSAGFEYTPDQKKAIEEIFSDLSGGKVMDRLLSGDVGFGKTEVAMNAIFATVKSGYQAAFLVPTTLLSDQHYKTLSGRLEPFGIKTAKLDRFVTPKRKKEVLEGLKNGQIDLVIGTHAVFGAEFKNLALVIVDEEHKFGVKQKESLKEMAQNLHLLSMSATPIPRSLSMALSRLKDFSRLTTPPEGKREVKSFVKEYDPKLVKEAVMRELRRGGQCFYVFNSIANIEQKREQLTEILPDIRILVLHSKIPAAVTERELVKFYKGEYDLLLSTSIVESGLHIPTVNTIIIDGADRFGMADLHQLRGRVGRGEVEGYCYMLVENRASLSEEATKRLIALENNSFLGSGEVLAMHDLEIRGGGNVLGAQQSGHIKNIGYSLYLKMLEEAIVSLSGGDKSGGTKIEIKLAVNAYINEDLVPSERVRLDLYRRLGRCKSTDEVYDIEEEIRDRFGKLDETTRKFIDIVIIKILGIKKGVKTISNYNQNVTFEYEDGKKIFFKARSKDDEDIISAVLEKLRTKE